MEHVAGKGTEKTLSRLITPVVKTDATDDEDPQVENVEMDIEENWVICLKQLHLNQLQLISYRAPSSTYKRGIWDRKRWPTTTTTTTSFITQHQQSAKCTQGQARHKSSRKHNVLLVESFSQIMFCSIRWLALCLRDQSKVGVWTSIKFCLRALFNHSPSDHARILTDLRTILLWLVITLTVTSLFCTIGLKISLK